MKKNKLEIGSMEENQGFTLIELSIVLVIIGLIVGGVLVGQDLIRAAEIRATVAQVEKYNSAVNTFRSKYGYIPGDMPQATAAAFGLFQLTNTAITGQGDGNGLIEGGGTGAVIGLGETVTFWRHLSDAQLVDGAYGVTGNSLIVQSTGAVTGTVSAGTMLSSLPPAKLGRGNFFIVYSPATATGTLTIGGSNYYQLLPIATIPASGTYTYNTAGISPIEASNIDGKMDDGAPNTGAVMARGIAATNAMPSVATATTAATCTIGTAITSDTYNRVAATGGNDNSCSLRMRFN